MACILCRGKCVGWQASEVDLKKGQAADQDRELGRPAFKTDKQKHYLASHVQDADNLNTFLLPCYK
jgi:hypothetical protein